MPSTPEPEAVTLLSPGKPGHEVICRGKRVPMLEAFPVDGGKVTVVFDRRLGLDLDAANYVPVLDFLAAVMENVMNPDCGRTFNKVVEIGRIPENTVPLPDPDEL